jgi:hypothetical protein
MRALLTGHIAAVASVAVGQADGRTIIVSGSYDQTLRIGHITFRRRQFPRLTILFGSPITAVALCIDHDDKAIIASGSSLWK